jgi:hypothetical protein
MEAYRQQLLNVPVVNNSSRTFWLLNELDGFAQEALVSKGNGQNKGIDISLERFFSGGWFFLGAFSFTSSHFEALNGIRYDTRFNSGSSGAFTGAKEWGMKKNKILQAGWKMVYNGGFRLTPLLPGPVNSREPVLDESRPYTEQVTPYFRTDARISLRRDKAGRSWQLALDIQNIFSIKNTDGLSRRYDPTTNSWVLKEQSGIVPVLSYQVDF